MLKTFHILIGIILLAFTSNEVYGQRIRVVDADDNPISLAHLQACGKIYLSDKTGVVAFDSCDTLLLSCLGYNDTTLIYNNIESGSVEMRARVYSLAEASVPSKSTKLNLKNGPLNFYYGTIRPKVLDSEVFLPYIELAQEFSLGNSASQVCFDKISIQSLQRFRLAAKLNIYAISGADTSLLGLPQTLNTKLKARKPRNLISEQLCFKIPANSAPNSLLISMAFDLRQSNKDITVSPSDTSFKLSGEELLLAIHKHQEGAAKVYIRYDPTASFKLVEKAALLFEVEGEFY